MFNLLKRNVSTFKIYRNNNGKTRMDSFKINTKDCGPMVLDGLIHILESSESLFFIRG